MCAPVLRSVSDIFDPSGVVTRSRACCTHVTIMLNSNNRLLPHVAVLGLAKLVNYPPDIS